MTKKQKAIRIGCAALAILFAFILQTTILKKIPYVSVTPNLLLILVCSFGLIRGKKIGLWTGFATGLLVDIFYGGQIIGVYALVYMYIGFINGLLSDVLLKDVVAVPIIFCFCSEIIYHGYVYVFTFLLRRRLEMIEYVKSVMLPELILTVCAMIVLYGLFLWADKALNKLEKKGDNRLV